MPAPTLFETPLSERTYEIFHWLTDVLGSDEFRLEPGSSDASFRRYFRATLDDESYIIMDAPPVEEDCGPFLDVARRLRSAGVNAPEIFAADVERGLVMLEDFSDSAYLDELSETNADELYGRAIETIVQMQTEVNVDELPPFNAGAIAKELDLFPVWFLDRHLEIALSNQQQNILKASFALLTDACLAQPQTFVHRDYHSRNLMCCDGAHPGVIDFQDAVVGPMSYDLVSLLRDVYIRWPAERVATWCEEYVNLAVDEEILSEEDAKRFETWFNLVGAQRHLKIAGIFCRLYYRDNKPHYLQDIALSLDYLLDECESASDLHPLLEVLDGLDLQTAISAANHRELADEI